MRYQLVLIKNHIFMIEFIQIYINFLIFGSDLVVCVQHYILFLFVMGMCSCSKQDSENVSKPIHMNAKMSSAILKEDDFELFSKKIAPVITKKQKKKLIGYQLLYRASENSYSAQKFHNATDGIGKTILLVKTNNNSIFGAYTPCKWAKDVLYKYEKDQNGHSFLFSLKRQDSQNSKENIKMQIGNSQFQIFTIKDNEKAIMNHSESGPVFGEGHDIFISNRCNKSQNWTNLGKTYECCFTFGSQKANRALSKQDKFMISEYEVWAIQLK